MNILFLTFLKGHQHGDFAAFYFETVLITKYLHLREMLLEHQDDIRWIVERKANWN